MPANIMQRADDTIVATDNYQRVASNRDRKKFPRFNNLTRVPHKHPLPPKNPLNICCVHCRVRVKLLRHRVPFAPRGNQVVEDSRSIYVRHHFFQLTVVGSAFQRGSSSNAAMISDPPSAGNT